MSDAATMAGTRPVMTDRELRRGLYAAATMALYLPPFVGGTLMGIAGYFPMPQFYLIFLSYGSPYVLAVSVLVFAFAHRAQRFFAAISSLAPDLRTARATRGLRGLMGWAIIAVTLYSIGGALVANLSLVQLGLRGPYSLAEHLYTISGLVPVVLITTFPIFFYLTDLIGRYLAPRGVVTVAASLSSKLFVLGLFTPILIDTLLIAYLANRTGSLNVELMLLWCGLIAVAGIGTWLAWRSTSQGLQPLRDYIDGKGTSEAGLARLVPVSLDELGMLTGQLQRRLEAEQRLTAIIEASPELVAIADPEGRITYMNAGGRRMLGLAEDFDVTTSHIPDYHDPATAQRILYEVLPACMNSGTWEGESEFLRRDGTSFPAWQVVMAHRGPGGEVAMISTITRDLTERKLAEERIQAALREKEVLLKEIYHRVKNNLQVVASLLAMQGRSAKDDGTLRLLEESSNRVKSMALVHEQLYQSKDLSNVRFREYTRQLVEHLMYAHRPRSQAVPVRVEVAEIDLGVETAIPCGLILNELISNAYKHGYGDNAKGEIELRAERLEDGRVRLRVSDDGRGLPEGFDARRTNSLGMQLVATLTAQLEGELRHGNGRGAWFEIVFRPAAREAQRLVA